jgi:hypothetical protein
MNRFMKTLPLLLFAAFTAVADARAQYTIDWSTMDGGSGSGTAGNFAMDGTLGQPDAAAGAAGSLALFGGYWALTDEVLPLLRIFRFNADIILAWPNPSQGFVLQETAELAAPDWNEVNIEPVIVGDEKQVNWGPPVDRHFFRLRRP